MGLLRVGTNCVGLHKTIIQITFLCICPNCKLYLSKLLNVQSENFLSFNWTNTFANMGLCRFGPKCAGLHLNMKNLFNLNELDYGVFDQVTRYISCQISKWFVSVKKNICHHGAFECWTKLCWLAYNDQSKSIQFERIAFWWQQSFNFFSTSQLWLENEFSVLYCYLSRKSIILHTSWNFHFFTVISAVGKFMTYTPFQEGGSWQIAVPQLIYNL